MLALQRAAGNAAVRRVLQRAPTVGWAGVDPGSTNLTTRTTTDTSIKRVPVKGIASGRGPGNALVPSPSGSVR